MHPSAAAALEMIQNCERELRVQLDTESCLTGLDYVVRGRLKSLYSVPPPHERCESCESRRSDVGL